MKGEAKMKQSRRNKIACTFCLLMLFLLSIEFSVLSTRFVLTSSSPRAIWVPDDYCTIQEAINAADEGETIRVRAGIYKEAIIIDKSVNVIGVNGSAVTIIDAGDEDINAVVTIESSHVRVENFTIQHTPAPLDAGIRIKSALKSIHEVVIHRNNIFNVDFGIENGYTVSGPRHLLHDAEITENNITFTALVGIYLSKGNNLLVSKNIFIGGVEFGEKAIEFVEINETEISGNNMSNFEMGVELQRGGFNEITNNMIIDVEKPCIMMDSSYNNINDNKIKGDYGISVDGNFTSIYRNTIMEGEHDGISVTGFFNNIGANTITDDWRHGISVWESSNNIINNTIQRVNSGVRGGAYVSGNEIRDCTTGVNTSGNASIVNNFFRNCTKGLVMTGNLSTASSNTFVSCLYGVYVWNGTDGNVICDNMFLNSTAVDDSEEFVNSWDNGTIGGNYWFNYEYEDFDGDGFGDTPHNIFNVYGNKTTSMDNYPLIVPRDPIPVLWKERINDEPCEMQSYITVLCNMTVSRFHLDEKTKLISFNVTGHGYCNLTIPRDVLDGSFKIFAGNTQVPWISSWNDTHTSIYFEIQTSIPLSVEIKAQVKLACDVDGDGDVDIKDIAMVAKRYDIELIYP